MVSEERLDAFVRGRCWAVVKEAAAAGLDHLWFQPGAESEAALAYCEAHGMEAISGHCILQTPERDRAEGHGFGPHH